MRNDSSTVNALATTTASRSLKTLPVQPMTIVEAMSRIGDINGAMSIAAMTTAPESR